MPETLASFELADMDLKPDITNPEIDPSSDAAPNRCQQPGCTTALVKPARGRTPKFCDEHKRGGTATGSKSGVSGKSWPRAQEIESILTKYVEGVGMGLMLLNPADGEIVAQGGPAIVHELVELAKTDKNMRKYLEWLATPGKYAPLTMACAGVALPIMANHGIMPPLFLPKTQKSNPQTF